MRQSVVFNFAVKNNYKLHRIVGVESVPIREQMKGIHSLYQPRL